MPSENLLIGWILKGESGKEFAVIFEDRGIVDILYANGFQRRDVNKFEMLKRCDLVKDMGSSSKAIDYIMAGSSKEDASVS